MRARALPMHGRDVIATSPPPPAPAPTISRIGIDRINRIRVDDDRAVIKRSIGVIEAGAPPAAKWAAHPAHILQIGGEFFCRGGESADRHGGRAGGAERHSAKRRSRNKNCLESTHGMPPVLYRQ